jgi:hypothetical protein
VHLQAQIPVGVVLYPLVPWVGVMAAGYGFGTIYRWDPARRLRALLVLGGALCAAFIARVASQIGCVEGLSCRSDRRTSSESLGFEVPPVTAHGEQDRSELAGERDHGDASSTARGDA